MPQAQATLPNPRGKPIKTDSALQQTADEQQQGVVKNMAEIEKLEKKEPKSEHLEKMKSRSVFTKTVRFRKKRRLLPLSFHREKELIPPWLVCLGLELPTLKL